MAGNSTISSQDEYRVDLGIKTLLKLDEYLLENDLNERSITHKLAEHLQYLFPEWNVDCEFNRNLGDLKRIVIDPIQILQEMANTLESNGYLLDSEIIANYHDLQSIKSQMRSLELQLRNPKIEYIEELGIVYFLLTLSNGKTIKKTIYPDIIVHHRGTIDNHIVFEAKKSINKDPMARAYDLVKLMTLVSSPDFNYRRGYFIDLPVSQDFSRFKKFSDPKRFCSLEVYKIEPIY